MSSRILFVDLVALPEGPHPIPFRTRSLSLPGPMVLRLKARESRSPPGLPRGCAEHRPAKVQRAFASGRATTRNVLTLLHVIFAGPTAGRTVQRGVEQPGSSSG